MNSYDKLRPWTEIEACECAEVRGLFLIDMLTDNPIHCAHCRREVDPERISLSMEETEAIAGGSPQQALFTGCGYILVNTRNMQRLVCLTHLVKLIPKAGKSPKIFPEKYRPKYGFSMIPMMVNQLNVLYAGNNWISMSSGAQGSVKIATFTYDD